MLNYLAETDLSSEMILLGRPLAFVTLIGINLFSSPGDTFTPNSGSIFSVEREIELSAQKGLDLDRWRSTLIYNSPFAEGGHVELWQSLDVLLHHPPGFHRQWKIDEYMQLSVRHRITKSLSAVVMGGVETFSDQQARRFQDDFRSNPFFPSNEHDIETSISNEIDPDNTLRSWYFSAGGTYTGQQDYKINGSAGPLFDFRSGSEQRGTRFTAGFDGGELVDGFNSQGWLEALPSGRDYSYSATVSNEHYLAGDAVDKYTVIWSQSEQRETPLSSNLVNRRIDELLHLVNILSTGQSAPIKLTWRSELNRQRSSHKNQFTDYSDLESNWSNGIDFDWQKRAFNGRVSTTLDIQEQEYAGSLTQGRRTLVRNSTTYRRNSRDTVQFKASVIKYKFDTPDESEFNDRDELRYQFSLHAGKMITPQVGIRLSIESDLRHLVYLYRSRSGENRWERTFRLTASVPWIEKGMSNHSRFAVISRFADYDYQPATNTLSRVYRSFTASDSLLLEINNHLQLRINASFVQDDHGRLRWNDWVEDISEEGVSYSLVIAPALLWKGFRAHLGWGLNHRETTQHLKDDRKVTGERIRSHGPLFTVEVMEYYSFEIELTGRVLWVTDRLRGNYRLPDVRGTMKWTIG